jgi:predicted oxidoreductase
VSTHATITVHADHHEVRAHDSSRDGDLVSLGVGLDTRVSFVGSLAEVEAFVAVLASKLTQVRFARQLAREECAGGGAHTLSALEHTDLGGTILECTAPGCGGRFVEAGGRLCPVIPDVDGYVAQAVAS